MDSVEREWTSLANTLNRKLVRKCSTTMSYVLHCISNSFEVVREQLSADQEWPTVSFLKSFPESDSGKPRI